MVIHGLHEAAKIVCAEELSQKLAIGLPADQSEPGTGHRQHNCNGQKRMHGPRCSPGQCGEQATQPVRYTLHSSGSRIGGVGFLLIAQRRENHEQANGCTGQQNADWSFHEHSYAHRPVDSEPPAPCPGEQLLCARRCCVSRFPDVGHAADVGQQGDTDPEDEIAVRSCSAGDDAEHQATDHYQSRPQRRTLQLAAGILLNRREQSAGQQERDYGGPQSKHSRKEAGSQFVLATQHVTEPHHPEHERGLVTKHFPVERRDNPVAAVMHLQCRCGEKAFVLIPQSRNSQAREEGDSTCNQDPHQAGEMTTRRRFGGRRRHR